MSQTSMRAPRRSPLPAALLALALGVGACAPGEARPQAEGPYYPGPGDAWQHRTPAQVGIDAARLQKAVEYAESHDNKDVPYDLLGLEDTFGLAVGPVPESRGGPAGMVIRHGYIVAEWGDPKRVDLTFSATKSFVSTTLGLAYDAGMIKDVNEPIANTIKNGMFASEHNRKITWQNLLQQTSEWEGTLWQMPDTFDLYHRRNRKVGRQEPGKYWEYNDVRVNLTAYVGMLLWKRPLPEVLKEKIMDPIGASETWSWHGYNTSNVVLDGKRMNSVSGGGHWGGGLWINARDMGRFGLLFLRDGVWNGKRLISSKWIDLATTPTDIRPVYGYLWWLTPESAKGPGQPVEQFAARGHGGNTIWVDRTHDLVVVTRWFGGDWKEFEKLIVGSVVDKTATLDR
ncbi:MAG TPA: serine hydrolase [Longimicrobiales bacterium]|nr:serine hydrolase [Longimicrobiales bacterium]